MAEAAELRVTSVSSVKIGKIIKTTDTIIRLFNESNILRTQKVIITYSEGPAPYFNSLISLEENGTNIAECGIRYEIQQESVVGWGGGVSSSDPVAGQKLGTLLFHLQMLSLYSSGVKIFYLNNATDEPHRAARGIYSLLEVDKTGKGYDGGEERGAYAGQTLEEQLRLSEGSMRLVIDSDFYKKWRENIIELSQVIDADVKYQTKWNVGFCEKNMKSFITKYSQHTFSGGGKSKKTKKTLRKKTRKNRKKIKRHRKTKVRRKSKRRRIKRR